MDPLVRIVDAAMAEAVRKAGSWLACRPGCAHCCIGAFPISQADALRLGEGLAALDPARAAAVHARADDFLRRHGPAFPGNLATGMLDETPEAEERFDAFAEDEPCPALDPLTLTCDLYAHRPITCRTFGPAVSMGGDAVGICELCFVGATEEEIAAATVNIPAPESEDRAQTLVAFALRTPRL